MIDTVMKALAYFAATIATLIVLYLAYLFALWYNRFNSSIEINMTKKELMKNNIMRRLEGIVAGTIASSAIASAHYTGWL